MGAETARQSQDDGKPEQDEGHGHVTISTLTCVEYVIEEEDMGRQVEVLSWWSLLQMRDCPCDFPLRDCAGVRKLGNTWVVKRKQSCADG